MPDSEHKYCEILACSFQQQKREGKPTSFTSPSNSASYAKTSPIAKGCCYFSSLIKLEKGKEGGC